MRRTTTAITAALLLALTGCSSSGSSDDAKPAAASPSANPDADYLADAHGLTYTGNEPSDDELLVYPSQWCKNLADGHSVEYIFDMGGVNLYPYGAGWGLKKAGADQLLVAGVRAYCPKELDAVTAELRAGGGY